MSTPPKRQTSPEVEAIVRQVLPALIDALIPRLAAEVRQIMPIVVKETLQQIEDESDNVGSLNHQATAREKSDNDEADDEASDINESEADTEGRPPPLQQLQIEDTRAVRPAVSFILFASPITTVSLAQPKNDCYRTRTRCLRLSIARPQTEQ
jgi:hypothetical protein